MASYIIAASLGNNPVSHYFFGLGAELARRGHSVVMVVDGQRKDAEKSGNPRVLTWPSRRPTKFRDGLFLHRLIGEVHPSVIIANFGSVNVSMLVGSFNHVPVRVAWYHTLSRQLRLDSSTPAWKRWLLDRRKAAIYYMATNVVAVSKAALEDARTTYKVSSPKIRALAMLLPDPFVPATPRDASRILCVGRLYPSKGQATLIRALPEIRRAIPTATAEFLGEGPSREDYVRLAASLGVAEQCRFSGWLPLEKVHEGLLTAAVAVVASHSEAYGLAAVEAQAMGIPLVASDVDGMKETVIDRESGYLVPPGDPEALAERIIALLRDPELRTRMGNRARQHFLDQFSNSHIGLHADLFEELAR